MIISAKTADGIFLLARAKLEEYAGDTAKTARDNFQNLNVRWKKEHSFGYATHLPSRDKTFSSKSKRPLLETCFENLIYLSYPTN